MSCDFPSRYRMYHLRLLLSCCVPYRSPCPVSAVTPGSYIITTYHSTLREYESVVWHSRLLGLGVPPTQLPDTDYASFTSPVENGVQSILSPSLTALVNKAAFGNACEFLASVRQGFNVSACEAFNGGVMKRGLNAAIQQWFLNAQEAGERQIRGQFIIGHLFEGAGWSIPQDVFNYSTAVRALCLPCRASC